MSKLLDRLPRGYWSGLGFGLLTFVLTAVLATIVYWAFRPFVWAAVYGVPYESPPGPYSPLSGEWLFVQFIWFTSAVALGLTVCRLSGRKTWRVLLTLAMLWLALTVLGEPNQGAEGWRLVLHYMQVPLGVTVGHLLYRRAQAKSASYVHVAHRSDA